MRQASVRETHRPLSLELLKTQVSNCQRCHLGSERIQTVFGVGNPYASLVFLGEGPGHAEDHRGEPFIGPAGKLLNRMIEEILGCQRKNVYISNIVKCHAMINPVTPDARGNDRPPTEVEMRCCEPWWKGEMAIIRPKIICLLGASALRAIYGEGATISVYRGQTRKKPELPDATLLATYHPAGVLRNPNFMEAFQSDFCTLKKLLEDPAPVDS